MHEKVSYYYKNLPADTDTGTWSKSKLKLVILSNFFSYSSAVQRLPSLLHKKMIFSVGHTAVSVCN